MSDLAHGAVSVNGRISAPAEARVAAMDHGFLFGDSVYEVVAVLDGRPFAWPEHLARLHRSAEHLYLDLRWSDDEITSHVRAAVDATGLRDCYARVVVSRGVGPMSLLPDECRNPNLLVYALPLVRPAPEDLRDGIAVAVPDRLRNDVRAISPAAKTGNYLNNLLALTEARRAGGADAVMLNGRGEVTEATTANVFWVRAGEIHTPSPDCGILVGITRTLLLEQMRREGLVVHEGRYPLEALTGADEAFLTGTIRTVMPVIRIGDRPVGDGAPGPVTRRVQDLHGRATALATRDW